MLTTSGGSFVDALEALLWMLENRKCLCGGELEEDEEGYLICKRCKLRIKLSQQ